MISEVPSPLRTFARCAGFLCLGLAQLAQAERYETITRDDGTVEVRRVETLAPASPEPSAAPEVDPGTEGGAANIEPQRRGDGVDKTAADVQGVKPQPFEPDDSYIDAAELEKAGFQRDDRQKFYTYVDESGQFRSRPYQDVNQLETASPSQLTGQQILAEEQWLVAPKAPEAAEAEAARILGLNNVQATRDIDRLADACCVELLEYMRKLEYPVDEIDADDGIALNIEADEADFGFGTGRSTFRVISLEEMREASRVRLRSFVHANKSDLFYPAVMTLDADWKPVRLFNNILYSYEPDSWFRRAYLEGFLELDPSREAYAVVLSRQGDQSRKSVVYPDEFGPAVLNHVRHGTLLLSPIRNPG